MPTHGFDPSEVAIPWKLFVERGFEIVFITPEGIQGTTDPIMLTGKGLGLFKSILAARQDAVVA